MVVAVVDDPVSLCEDVDEPLVENVVLPPFEADVPPLVVIAVPEDAGALEPG